MDLDVCAERVNKLIRKSLFGARKKVALQESTSR